MRTLRQIVRVLRRTSYAAIFIVLVAYGLNAQGTSTPPTTPSATATQWLANAQHAASSAWSSVDPIWLWLVAAVIVLLIGLRVVRSLSASSAPRDPRRDYSSLRPEIFARANGRCEYERWWRSRCHHRAEHADHAIAWAKGGATSLTNGVASCAHHNLAKSDHDLTRAQVRRLEARRRHYFPTGADVTVGERYRR